jgi:hypothetical protein
MLYDLLTGSWPLMSAGVVVSSRSPRPAVAVDVEINSAAAALVDVPPVDADVPPEPDVAGVAL